MLTMLTFPLLAFFTEHVMISPMLATLPFVLIHSTSFAPLLSETCSRLPAMSIIRAKGCAPLFLSCRRDSRTTRRTDRQYRWLNASGRRSNDCVKFLAS